MANTRALTKADLPENTALPSIAVVADSFTVRVDGEIIEALSNGKFRIALDNGHETLGYTAGRLRRYRIRMMPGDRVKIELSPYDLQRGRIVYRYG